MKFPTDNAFDADFANISGIRYFPYVGKKYLNEENKILIFGYNRYCDPLDYDTIEQTTANRNYYASNLEEFAYSQSRYTKTFRSFLRGALGIKYNFNMKSPESNLVEDFLHKVSYTNYINDFVISKQKTGVIIDTEQIEKSRIINEELLSILMPTHIICWGKVVFDLILNNPRYSVISRKNLGKIGFESAVINDLKSGTIHNLLKVFHPSMPQFGINDARTHTILKTFLQVLR